MKKQRKGADSDGIGSDSDNEGTEKKVLIMTVLAVVMMENM